MEHVRNGLIINLTISFKNIICQTNFKPKIIINFKKIADRDRNCLIGQNSLFIRARIRKLPVHDHMTKVFKIDFLTGHEEMGTLHFIMKIVFNCIFIEKPCIFLKLVQLIMKV